MDPRTRRLEPILIFLLVALYGAIFLPVLTDWVSFIVDEGFTSYGAQRLREGQWPHRDFFFLWTPGILGWHALLQSVGLGWIGERASALLFSAFTPAAVWAVAKAGGFPIRHRLTFFFLVVAWGYSLWNIPYASWYAVACGMAAIWLLPRSVWAAGLAWALAFWFKQNVGILGFGGALAVLVWDREGRRAAKFLIAFTLGLALPFAVFGFFGGREALVQALRQIFFFPISYPRLMGTFPGREMFSSPLVAFGLWLLTLFTLRPDLEPRLPRMLRGLLLIYLFYCLYSKPGIFLLGWFLLISVMAWIFAGGLALAELATEERRRFFAFFLPALGMFCQVAPRFDFQHVLFVFPLSLLCLLWAEERLSVRYRWLKGAPLYLPLILLALGGGYFQLRTHFLRWNGQRDALGMISYGEGHRNNEEMKSVMDFLAAEGLKRGDPILVLPNATSFYNWSGLRNPTPYDQFFPGYVEAFGGRQADVLPAYEKAGGRFLVWQRYSGLELNAPELAAAIPTRYFLRKEFPYHFSVWEKKAP